MMGLHVYDNMGRHMREAAPLMSAEQETYHRRISAVLGAGAPRGQVRCVSEPVSGLHTALWRNVGRDANCTLFSA